MKKSHACSTIILASMLMLLAACEKANKPARTLDSQNVNSKDRNTANTVAAQSTQNGEAEVEEEHDCHDPDCSPVAGEGVILLIDDECRLHAVDAKTGMRKWLFESEKLTDYLPIISNGSAYVASNKGIYSLDMKTGRVNWRLDVEGYVRSPKVAGDVVLFPAGDKNLYAVSAKTGKRKWRYKIEDDFGEILLTDEKRVYVESAGDLHALDLETGNRAWRLETEGRDPIALVTSKGMVCMGLDEGTVIALDAETGQESWRLKTEFDIPLVRADEDSVFFGNGFRLQAVDVRTGKEKWRSEKGYNRVGYIAAIANGEIYFEDADHIYAVAALTGQETWRYERKAWDHSPLVVADQRILFMDGPYFYALDAPTKKELWKIKLKEESGVFKAPVAMGGALYFIEGCALLSGAEIKTGKLRWTFTP